MNSLFSGPITITGLEFFNTQFNSGAHEESAIDTGTFTVSLSTTSASWDTLEQHAGKQHWREQHRGVQR